MTWKRFNYFCRRCCDMPMYLWECSECGRRDEGFRTVAERHDSAWCHGQRMGIVICPPAVQADLPGYVSPATGKWIDGRAARREDLKAAGCRPWEGFDAENREARKRAHEIEAKADAHLDASARRALAELPPAKRRILESP